MTASFVADASLAVAWVHPGQATPETARMLEAVAEGAVIEVPGDNRDGHRMGPTIIIFYSHDHHRPSAG